MAKKLKSKDTNNSDQSKVSRLEPDVRRVKVSDIVVDKDAFRDLNEAVVAELAESIDAIGLMHFPTVSIRKDEDGSDDGEIRLVAGQHRLDAIKKLGWDHVHVTVVRRKNDKNRMRQITENLHRSDLDMHERAKLIQEWVELCAKEGGQVAHPQKTDKGISRAAKRLGVSNKSIRRGIKVSKVVPEAAKVLKQANLAKEKWLLKVADAAPEDQVAAAREIVETHVNKKRKPKMTRAAQVEESKASETSTTDEDWDDTPFGTLKAAWDESPNLRKAWLDADAGDRQRFIHEVLLADEAIGDEADGDDDWDEGSGTSINAAAA